MKGVFCYYSGTGNTRLACEYIVANVRGFDIVLHDIVKDGIPVLDEYDMVGFAAFADWLGPSQIFRNFVSNLPTQTHKPAFVFNTFGNFNGRTLQMMTTRVRKKGFFVVAAHALHMPENIPTMTTTPWANRQAPNDRELREFHRFIARLNALPADPSALLRPENRYRIPWSHYLMPTLPRALGIAVMGKKMVNEALCNKCGICVTCCPYKAITLAEDGPLFDEKKCCACWACYNRCPQKAIRTKAYNGIGHYPRPIAALREKLPIAQSLLSADNGQHGSSGTSTKH
jgi:ferredoxin